MNTLSNNLQKNLTFIKYLLPSEDILTYRFQTQDKTPCAIVYADGMVNKQLIGELVAKPLSALNLQERRKESNESTSSTDDKKTQKETDVAPPPSNGKKSQKEGGRDENTLQIIKQSALFPELKEQKKWEDVVKEVLDGNVLLFVDGMKTGVIIGAKLLPTRAVIEPPTDIAVKGPREGFIEDAKTNMVLIRKRLKTPAMQLQAR